MEPRTVNKIFTAEEKTILINLIRTKKVIEDKRTDVVSLSRKKTAWEEVEREFNSNSAVIKRSLPQLRKCWDNLKTKRKKDLAQEMRQRMRTGGGPAPPATSPNPELDLAVPHLGHHVGFWFDSDVNATGTPPESSQSDRPAGNCVLLDTVVEVDSPCTQDSISTPVCLLEMPAGSSTQDQSCTEVWTGSDTPVITQEVIQDQAPERLPSNSTPLRTRQSVVEKELQARLRRHQLEIENDAKLQSLREKELQLLVDDARERLNNTKKEEERRKQSFEWEEERKKQSFEAEERRKDELHKMNLALLKKSSE